MLHIFVVIVFTGLQQSLGQYELKSECVELHCYNQNKFLRQSFVFSVVFNVEHTNILVSIGGIG